MYEYGPHEEASATERTVSVFTSTTFFIETLPKDDAHYFFARREVQKDPKKSDRLGAVAMPSLNQRPHNASVHLGPSLDPRARR